MQHLDEGTIHAWLDGQLPRDEATAVEAHVADCRQCADAVAEARGLIAASSRILTALDNVPRDVAPKRTPALPTAGAVGAGSPAMPTVGAASAAQRARRRWFSAPSLAAAATIVVAVGTLTVMRAGKDMRQVSLGTDRAERAAANAPVAVMAVDSQTSSLAAAPLPPAAPPTASSESAPGISNEAPAAGSAGGRRTLADGARRESDEVGAARSRTPADTSPLSAAPPRPIVARAGVDSASNRAANLPLRDARADVSSISPVRAAETREQGQQPRDFAKAREQAVVTAAPAARKPDTMTVRVFRGAKAEVARFSDSTRIDAVAKVSADVAAGTGTVRGRVTDANNTGLGDVMVQVAGTSIGVATSPAGSFELRGIGAGSQRITARRIGFAPGTLVVTVGAGQVASADFKLAPSPTSLENVVVTGVQERIGRQAAAPSPAPSAQALQSQLPSATAYGCYDLGITPGTSQARTGFRPLPRRVALDSTIVRERTDGVWYVVRDLSGSAAAGNGVWRPTGADAIEAHWNYGSRTATIRLTGVPGQVLRGTVEEIDRTTAVGAAGTVVAGKVRCPAG